MHFQGSLIVQQPLSRGWAYNMKKIIGREEDFEPENAEEDDIHLTDIIPKENTDLEDGIRNFSTPIASHTKSCSRFCAPVDE
jgi:hypothetical protein